VGTVVYKIPGRSAADLIFIPVEFGISWLAGFAVRDRAEKTEVAEERATRAERERETAARIAVAEERVRIARAP
jgi:signal transduction histidine kinase